LLKKQNVAFVLFFVFAVGVVPELSAWCARTHRKITSDAYFIICQSFRDFLGETKGDKPQHPHLKALLDASVEPDSVLKDFRNHVFHIQGYDLGNGPFHVANLAKEISEDIKNKAPIAQIVQKLGWISHYIADLTQPLHTGVETWEGIEEKAYHKALEQDVDKHLYEYGVLFDGSQAITRLSARMVYEALWANQFYSAMETAYTTGNKYEEIKYIAAKCYSKAVNNVVDIWYSIWAMSGGKIDPKKDGKPKYYPPFWRKDLNRLISGE